MSIDEKPPTFKEVARDLGRRAPDLARWLLGDPASETRHQFRYRNKGSLVVIVAGTEAGSWFDHDPPASARNCESGDALNLIAHIQGVTLIEAYKQGLEFLGVTPSETADRKGEEQNKRQKIDRALAIWSEGRKIEGTIAEKYLRGRGITCALSSDLKFHPECWSSETKTRMPAMLALFRDIADNKPCGVHRTFLARDGSGKASLKTTKLSYGRAKGAAIKLTPDEEITYGLGLTEGIETGLSLISVNYRGIWVAGSAGAIRAFPIIGGVEALTIFADNDESGTGIESARVCNNRWRHAGRECRVVYPRSSGCDWNDVVRAA
jgi:putative DNA primase/helicase